MSHESLTIGGARLIFRQDDFIRPGDTAPYILLQHGFPRNSNFWREWVPYFARDMRIIRPDLRGIGLSRVPLHDYEPSLEIFVDDAAAILDTVGAERVVWVGEATGTLLGIAMAALMPDRIQALVLTDAFCRVDSDQIRSTAGDMINTENSLYGEGASSTFEAHGLRGRARHDWIHHPQIKGQSSSYKEWYEDQFALTDGALAAKFYRALVGPPGIDCRPYLKDIKAPTLLLLGHNPLATQDDLETMRMQIADCRETEIDAAGWQLFSGQPEACALATRKFLVDVGILKSPTPSIQDAVGTVGK